MARIRAKDTSPELKVRSYLHSTGLRFRKNVSHLPGKPDIVLPRFRTVVFVHGCFWHRHRGCRFAYEPKTRKKFWREKFAANVRRDRLVVGELRRSGWRVRTIWECEVQSEARLRSLVNWIRGSSLR